MATKSMKSNPTSQSELSLVYDELVANEKLKTGTKYERLAAIIFQLLNSEDVVSHDLVLRGDGKEASHQIDVAVRGKTGSEKRILIECKDFGSESVGIGIVRDFFGAVSQLKPDEAFVVTTNKFTSGAKKFARDEGIKLAVLRNYDAKHDGPYISTINLQLQMFIGSNFRLTSWVARSPEDYATAMEKLSSEVGKSSVVDTQSTFFLDEVGTPTESFEEVISAAVQNIVKGFVENATEDELNSPSLPTLEGTWPFEQTRWTSIAGTLLPVKGFAYRVDVVRMSTEMDIGSAVSVRQLVLRSLDGSVDRAFTKGEIGQFVFSSDGKVEFKK